MVVILRCWLQFLAVASKFMRIFNLVCLIMLMAHWNGCLQWLVPMLQDFPSDSWPALEGLLVVAYYIYHFYSAQTLSFASVRPSVRHTQILCQNERMQKSSPSGSPVSLVFLFSDAKNG